MLWSEDLKQKNYEYINGIDPYGYSHCFILFYI